MDFLDQSGLDIAGSLLSLTVAAIAHIFIVRRLTTTLFDPVCYVALAGVFTIAITHVLAPIGIEIYVWFAYAVFWTGVLVVAPKLGGPAVALSVASPPSVDQELILKLVVGLSALLLIGVNALLWLKAGVPAFSDNPDLAKGALYQGGFGFVRRLNWGLGIFGLFATTLLFLRHQRLIWASLLLAQIVIAALGGGKGSLLPALYVVGLLTAHRYSSISGPSRILGQRLVLILAPLALLAAIALLLVQSDDLGGALQKLVTRLFFFGDIMIYWRDDDIRREISSRYSYSEYPVHALAPLLGMVRLVDYKVAIGNEIVSYSAGLGGEVSALLGPNTPFYVMGQIFFGPVGGLIYSFIVGSAFGLIRRKFIESSVQRGFHFCIWGTIVILSISLPTEDDLFVGTLTDFLLPLGLIYILSTAILRASKIGGICERGSIDVLADPIERADAAVR